MPRFTVVTSAIENQQNVTEITEGCCSETSAITFITGWSWLSQTVYGNN